MSAARLRVIRYENAAGFQRDALPLLMAREAENNLIIGRSTTLLGKPVADALLASVQENNQTIAAAMMTPPYHLVLTDGNDSAIDELARCVLANEIALPGVSGPIRAAQRFIETWHGLTGNSGLLRRSLRIFQLDRVIAPQRPPRGSFCATTLDDADLIMDWNDAFAAAIGEKSVIARENAMQRLRDGHYFLWRDPEPVSMAAWAGPTPNGIRINSVYTPVEYRNRGYASACVAALSQHLLDSGRKFVFLYTDLANPTSNSIYQKVGYRPVCDWSDYVFHRE